MGKSEDIRKRLIAGQTIDDLVRTGYAKSIVTREANTINQVRNLLGINYTEYPNKLSINRLMIYAQHNALEVAWGTLVGILGLAAAFKAMSQNQVALVFSGTRLDFALNRLKPPSDRKPWWKGAKPWLSLSFPIGIILILNGLGGLFNLEFLELLITYRPSSILLPCITITFGLAFIVSYILMHKKRMV
jgi:hypothetical protein